MAEEEKPVAKKIDASQQPVFAWEAEEFGVYQKSGSWGILVALAAIVVIVVFVLQKNWTGVALAVAAAAALISQGFSRPKKIRVAVFDGGIVINDKVHNFGEMKAFWLLASPHPMARFERASRFAMPISMPLGESNADQIRSFLLKRLPEHEDRGEDLSDTISRWIKF